MRVEQAHRSWQDARSVSLLGMGTALPGKPISTAQLLERLHTHFETDVRRPGGALAARLGIQTRYICRDLLLRHEAPRAGDSNAELAARALRCALDESGVRPDDLSYLIAHTTTPGRLLPANVAQVADLIGYRGPFVELPESLFFRRSFELSAVKYLSPYERMVMFEPNGVGELSFPNWRLLIGFLSAIHRVPVGWVESLRCYARMQIWMKRWRAGLIEDLVVALRYVVRSRFHFRA